MTTCPECGEPLQPLDVVCSACGAPRLEEQATTRPAATDSAPDNASVIDPSSQLQNDVRLGIIVFLFALINLLAFPLMESPYRTDWIKSDWIASVWLGTLFTQSALISVWCILAPVRAMNRTSWGLIIGSLWLSCGIIGGSILTSNEESEFWTVVCSIPLLLLLVQLPLWILRIWFRWRIVDRSDVATVQQPEKLRIRDVMLITGVVAGVLALAKLGNIGNSQSDAEFFGRLFVYGAVVLGAAAITIPNSLLAGMRRPREPKRIWQALIAQAVMVGGAGVGISFVYKHFPTPYVWGCYCVIAAMYFVATLTIFRIFARRGFRLLTNRDDPPAQPAGRRD